MKNSGNAAAPLEAFGLLVRGTRVKKGLTQQRAAIGAGVSRKQWALLEQGQNVSATFIQKVAAYLGLRSIPFGDNLEAVSGGVGIDVTSLIHLADEFETFAVAFAERIRSFAYDAAIPRSERSGNAEAIAGFVARKKSLEPEDQTRLSRAMEHLAADILGETESLATPVRRRSKTRKREA